MNGSPAVSTKAGERISFGLFGIGSILSYYLIYSFLQLYMTDIGISAVTVGVIFIIAKVWDAVNDPIFGVVIDKTRFKKGRFLPWLRIAGIAVPLTTILLFIIPADATIQIKIIWSTVAYIVWDAAYTILDAPANAIVTTMTENLQERNTLYSISAFFIYIGGLVIAIIVPMLYPTLGWGMTAIIVSALALISMIPAQFKIKERFIAAKQTDVPIKELLLYLVHNKYLLIYTGIAILGSLTGFSMTLVGYVAIHCLGSATWITPLALATAVPVLLVVLFVPKMIAKTDKLKVYIITRLVTVAIAVIVYFVGYGNVTLLLILTFIMNLFAAVWGVLGVMFIADCAEYGHFKTGQRAEGMTFTLKSFTNKMVVALTGAIAMFALASVGFVSGEGAVQTQATIKGIWFLYSLAPAISSIVAVVLMGLYYKLPSKDVQVMTRCNTGEITREEAEASLSRKY
jgi:glycoside/pentoside/hexuronide:cation symporter, GPH family